MTKMGKAVTLCSCVSVCDGSCMGVLCALETVENIQVWQGGWQDLGLARSSVCSVKSLQHLSLAVLW